MFCFLKPLAFFCQEESKQVSSPGAGKHSLESICIMAAGISQSRFSPRIRQKEVKVFSEVKGIARNRMPYFLPQNGQAIAFSPKAIPGWDGAGGACEKSASSLG